MSGGVGTASAGAASWGSSSLVSRLKARDPAAWDRFARLYGPLVYGWCRRAGLRDDDAADVAQEVFRGVAVGIDQFRRDRSGDSFRGWLRGIARHKLLDHYRRVAGQPDAAGGSAALVRLGQVASDPAADDPPPGEAARDLALLARRAMDLVRTDFHEATWRAFWETAVEGRPPADVAAELGLSVASVYSAKSRVLARLRQELADPLE
jgi:RNA polymerase sigma-70 factor (ECF subfamily)